MRRVFSTDRWENNRLPDCPLLQTPMYKYVFHRSKPSPFLPRRFPLARDDLRSSDSSPPTRPLSRSRCIFPSLTLFLFLAERRRRTHYYYTNDGSSRVGAQRICHPHQHTRPPPRWIVSLPSTCSASDDDARCFPPGNDGRVHGTDSSISHLI